MSSQEKTRRLLAEHKLRMAAEEAPPPPPPFKGKDIGKPTKRDIPKDHPFDPKSLKPLVQTLWSLSVSLGHALTAHRQFSRLKSVSFSPDGLIGGRGYVMGIKDVRTQLHQASEAISAVCDTLFDEINAPHWKPKLSQLEKSDDDFIKLLEDAKGYMDDPEGEAEEDMEEVESRPASWSRFKKEEDSLGSKMPNGGDIGNDSQGPNPASAHRPQLKQSSYTYCRTAAPYDQSVLGIPPDYIDDMDEIERRELAFESMMRGVDILQAAAAAFESELPSSDRSTLLNSTRKIQEIVRRRLTANSSVSPSELSGPRVDHLDRGEQTGPYGSYNKDEPLTDDGWGMDEGAGSGYAYRSEWDNNLSERTAETDQWGASAMPNDSDTRTEGYDFGIGFGNGNDAHGQGAGGYANPDSSGKGVYGPRAELPGTPAQKCRNTGTESIEQSTSGMGLPTTASARLPNDFDEPVARSDYYAGPKGNDFDGVVRNAVETWADSSLPGDDAGGTYDVDRDLPNAGYKAEQVTQPYVKWDSTTHNMRPDYTYQRDDEGPYPHD